ncbi:MAG: hypothetical protein ACLPUT_02415 [Solirubrobacteraceae bacterium]
MQAALSRRPAACARAGVALDCEAAAEPAPRAAQAMIETAVARRRRGAGTLSLSTCQRLILSLGG